MPLDDPRPPLSDRPVAMIIAAKDSAATIGAATASALNQDPVAEVIVVDDASTDGTAEAAEAQDDGTGRLRVIRLPANLGPSAARNRAIESSSAPIVGILDADDYLKPGRVAAMLALAPERWDLLADNMVFERNGQEDGSGDLLVWPEQIKPLRITGAEFVLSNLGDAAGRHRRELGFLKPLIRRSFLAEHGLRYDEALRLGEDYVLYAEALIRGAEFILVKHCGYVAIEHALSLSGVHGADELAALAAADRRLVKLSEDPAMTRALRRHYRATRLKVDYRRMLDAKREGRIPKMFAHLFRTPGTAAYIFSETFKARMAAPN